MRKAANEKNDVKNEKTEIKDKLEQIGLKLERIPKVVSQIEEIKYRAPKSREDNRYKIYKQIDVKDIEILITPTDRLDELQKKFKKADYLIHYMKPSDEPEEIEKNRIFYELVKKLDITRLQELEKRQEQFKEMLPYEIKYRENFIWQIFYSETSQKYFMLFPSNESEVESLFYIIQKKIQENKTKKKETIYVPISYEDYSNQYLKRTEIADLENYLWLFTNDWPSIYEVYDKSGNMTLQILGKAPVYGKIESNYKIVFSSKEEAMHEFKKIKALFILQTERPREYTFKTMVNENGSLDFYFGFKKISYETLPNFMKQEYLMKKTELEKRLEEIVLEEENLELLNQTVKKQNEEYILKEKQIVTFLECKRTFLGKVKYFFQSKKAKKTKEEKIKELMEEKQLEKEEPIVTIKPVEDFVEKSQCTLEDVLKIGNALEQKETEYKNIQMDKRALENKKENLERKIKNATLYINEIESHKKSIFDFWKYTNKDEVSLLTQAEEEEKIAKEKIKKVFLYEEDKEEIGQKMDDIQRERLSKNECDAMFTFLQDETTFQIVEKEKILKKDRIIIEKIINQKKEEQEKNSQTIQEKDFDLFGNKNEDKTKIKTLKQNKHREIEKDSDQLLAIKPDLTVEQYLEMVKNYKMLVKEAYEKVTLPIDLSVYKANKEVEPNKGYCIVSMNPEEAVKEISTKTTEFNLHCYPIQEGMNALFYTNIIFYENDNKTLPLGMDLSDSIIFDFDRYEVKLVSRKDFRMNVLKNEFENTIKVVHVYEYRVERK